MNNLKRLETKINDGVLHYTLDQYDNWGVLVAFTEVDDELVGKLKNDNKLEGIYVKDIDGDIKRVVGNKAQEELVITEDETKFLINLNAKNFNLQVSKFELRKLVKEYVGRKRKVLNLFGGNVNSMLAFAGNATEINTVEHSEESIEMLEKNIKINNFDKSKHSVWNEDQFNFINLCKESGSVFDLIIIEIPNDFKLKNGEVFDIQMQHSQLIREVQNNILNDAGIIFFIINKPGFQLDSYIKTGADKLTKQVTPEEFKHEHGFQVYAFYN